MRICSPTTTATSIRSGPPGDAPTCALRWPLSSPCCGRLRGEPFARDLPWRSAGLTPTARARLLDTRASRPARFREPDSHQPKIGARRASLQTVDGWRLQCDPSTGQGLVVPSQSTVGQISESEWRARKRRIDPRLRTAGWKIVPYDPLRPLTACDACAIEEYPTAYGPADYALCVAGRIVGIVEAKRVTVGPQNALTQAERYARGVTEGPFDFRGF